jgi:hypothetical protein
MSDPFDEGLAAARARRMRSFLIAGALLVFVALIFVVTVAKLQQGLPHG